MDWLMKLLGLPVLASEHGKDVDYFLVYVHWLMGALFVGWLAYFGYALWRFRATKNPKASYHGVQSHASSYLEGLVALIEILLLVGFAIPLWAKVVDDFPDERDSTVIRVVAEQFTWNSRYPGPDGEFGKQDILTASNENKFGYDPEDEAGKDDIVPPLKDIRVPVNKPVIIHLSSLDVIHSFSVHPLRVCQDCVPGMSVPVHFTPTRTGRFQITCAQLCGNGHYSMNGFLTVETPEDFEEWIGQFAASAAGADVFE